MRSIHLYSKYIQNGHLTLKIFIFIYTQFKLAIVTEPMLPLSTTEAPVMGPSPIERSNKMLNIRINVTIDVKKWAATFAALVIAVSQFYVPASALPAPVKPEKLVRVSLTYLTVETTKTQAKEALASPYLKYFDPQAVAFLTVYSQGLSIKEWKALNNLWQSESHFNPKARNMHSGAYGIAQFLPTTWANYKVTKTPSAVLQIKYGLHYIERRYGSKSDPAGILNAWAFHQKHGWY